MCGTHSKGNRITGVAWSAPSCSGRVLPTLRNPKTWKALNSEHCAEFPAAGLGDGRVHAEEIC